MIKNDKKEEPVHLDRVRPAHVTRQVHNERVRVSPSFAARFDYGKTARQAFYRQYAGDLANRFARFSDDPDTGLHLTRSFEQIIGDAQEGLPPSVSGKIAVFYADGNKFGKIREENGSIDDFKRFSAKLAELLRQLLGSILVWLRDGACDEKYEAFLSFSSDEADENKRYRVRFETLLWGGDELIFVMPAWLGIEFARNFCEWTKTWKAPSGEPPTFGMGLVFCHEKTPIRQARKVATALANNAKDTQKKTPVTDLKHVLQIEAFESIALPEHGLERYRASLFDLGDAYDKEALARALTLRGDQINSVLDAIKTLKDGAFPRSQIYDLLRAAKKMNGGFSLNGAPGAADNHLAAAAQKYFKRMNLNGDEELAKLRILGAGVPLAYSLAVISGLWDYVEPLALVPGNPPVGQPA